MSSEVRDVAVRTEADKIERVLVGGDLAQLKPEERVSYYKMLCESVGLNPLTKPFAYITLNGKLTLYALKDATDQLRNNNNISVTIQAREVTEDCYVVTARAATPTGRTDESIGAVSIASLKGEARCNAMMKAETKAKRRVTLSICGLGMLDETEIESIPASRLKEVERTTEDIPISAVAEKPTAREERVTAERTVGSGGVPAAPPSTAKPEPPTTKAAVKAVKAALSEPEHPGCIDSGRKVAFARAWADAAKAAGITAKDAELFRLDWLGRHGYADDNGPTSAKIPMADFERVKRDGVAFISSLRQPAKSDIPEDSIPF